MTLPINNKSIAIASHHCVTPFGVGPEVLWDACLNQKECFTDGFGMISDGITEECRDYVNSSSLLTDGAGAYYKNSLFHWTMYSILKAFEKAGWTELTDRDGIVLSTTTSFIMDWETELIRHLKGEKIDGKCYQPLGAFPQAIQDVLSHKGPCTMVSSACSASTQGIGIAKNWLNSGYVDRCLVVGAEELCHLTKSGFRSLSLVTEETCHPFNEEYSGITLSEAAAALCLEKNDEEKKYNSYVTGYGCVSDAYSMTSPRPDGSGPARSMEMAIKDAGLLQSDLDWIYAHGTGSLQNDRAEAAAVLSLELAEVPLSSTKAVHGHTLAASGALEVIISDYVLREQKILPSWKSKPESFNINVAHGDLNVGVQNILKNTLGFGGINSSLIISKGDS